MNIYLLMLQVMKDLQYLEEEELSAIMPKFVVEVRKRDGTEYPPNTLFQIVMGIQSYVKFSTTRDVKFLHNPAFERFRQVLDGEMKRLTQKGLGLKKRQAEIIEDEDEERLWSSGQLGDHNPRVLLHTVLYLNGKNFALRSGREHRSLRFENPQIQVKTDRDGKEFLQYTQDFSKTVQGGLKHRKIEARSVKHYANVTNPRRCHVRIFKRYLSLVPPDGHDAFYLQVLQHPTENCWLVFF